MFAPWFHDVNFNGAVPTGPGAGGPEFLALALTLACGPPPPAGVAISPGKVTSARFIRTVTSHGPVWSMLFTFVKAKNQYEFGFRFRFRLYITSAVVIGRPSWNFTPWRIVYTWVRASASL